ncbi:zinc finger domain-containing protein [Ureibacillus galli]|nr:zinc finger domain-containing protein [Ureibacillus galli]
MSSRKTFFCPNCQK